MRILQVLPELNEGGVERGAVELNRELVLRGHESLVMSNGGKLDPQISLDGGQHIKFDVCSKNIFTFWSRFRALKKVLLDLKPDIIHVRSRVPAWLVRFANKKLGIKVVSTVHGFNSVSCYSRVMTLADQVICVSHSVKEYIQKHYQTPENIITVVPRGVDLTLFDSNNLDHEFMANFRKEYDLDDKFVISSVGRVTQLKDYETFIKAVARIKQQEPAIKALIVGGVRSDKKDYLNSLTKLINDLNLESNIIFTGSKDKIAEVYAVSDAVISSSKKPETFGRSVAEAIAMETPVVASNHGGVKDIIIAGENGFFFEVGDDKALAEKIIATKTLKFDGHDYISRTFSLKQMVDKAVEVYNISLKI